MVRSNCRPTPQHTAYCPGVASARARLFEPNCTISASGYCALMDEVQRRADFLFDDLCTAQLIHDVPKYIVEAAREYRRLAGRSY